MATAVIEPDRIRTRRDGGDIAGDVVIYWMQSAQRARHNDALEHAIQVANDLDLPLAVVFCVVEDYPAADPRHYHFMFEGLAAVRDELARRSIAFTVFRSEPSTLLGALDHRTAHLVFDRGYLPIQRRWRDEAAESTTTPIDEVETEVVVPIHLVSDHVETAARTIRPKIQKHLDDFIVERRTTAVTHPSLTEGRATIDLRRTASSCDTVDLDDELRDGRGFDRWKGGTNPAVAKLRFFCTDVLSDYADLRNRFDLQNSSSELSPHLHFGQISPVEVVRRARASGADQDQVEAFVDEVVVRRELAANFVEFNANHASWKGLPHWATDTLDQHRNDDREAVFTAAELEAGETNDEIWNTIMAVIRGEGWVHNQLRMYWGKQVLRWTNNPEHAFRTLLDLNNRHFLDGRDANSYANVAWCFGRHDQGFQERDVIGKIRPFTDQALQRKGDLDAWLESNR